MNVETARLLDVEQTFQRFLDAWMRADAAALDALLSPTFTYVDVTGALRDRATWLALAPGRAALFKTQLTYSEVEIRIVGDVAIRTCRVDFAAPDGATAEASVRSTDVWVRSDGRWLREASQATFI